MNEEFSGRGPGTRARENRRLEHWEGFGRWERKGRVMGVLKGWNAGEKGEITQHCLKFAIEKWLNDSKNKRTKFSTTFRNQGCQEKKGRKKLMYETKMTGKTAKLNCTLTSTTTTKTTDTKR